VAPHAVPDAYVALCLRLRRLVPAFVDAGAVDPAIRRSVADEPPPTAAELVRQAGRLAAELPDAGLEPGRGRFLAAQLRAVEWRSRRLAGQHVTFRGELRECLDIEVASGEPDAYRSAHRELAALLPGPGSVAERLATHRCRDAVAPGRLADAVDALTAALRHRVAGRYGLPARDAIEHRLVHNVPWRALHTYSGGHRSIVRINVGAGLRAGQLARLVAHETYPGHHTECSRAETGPARHRVELGLTVLGTPHTVVSEGMAESALDTAMGAEWGRWASQVLGGVGVPLDGELAERLDPVLATLRRARLDAALLLHDAGPPTSSNVAGAEAHLRRWLLLDAMRARRLVATLARPLWRAHVAASVEGSALVRSFLRHRDPVGHHLRLLDDPPTPTALLARSMATTR
jgi:hypothetical protein